MDELPSFEILVGHVSEVNCVGSGDRVMAVSANALCTEHGLQRAGDAEDKRFLKFEVRAI